MSRINYKIEDFEGPLDLLLTLIRKNKMSIRDVEIITIINQYLRVIESTPQQDLDAASEFIDMAARLIYLKSVYLLPKDDEGEKLKAQLQGRLIDYQQAKRAARLFRARYKGDSLFVRLPAEIHIDLTYDIIHPVSDLTAAYSRIQDRSIRRQAPDRETFEPIVSAPVVSVASKIYTLLKGLIRKSVNSINTAFRNMSSRSEAVATFLAVLELVRAHRIAIESDGGLTLVRGRKDK